MTAPEIDVPTATNELIEWLNEQIVEASEHRADRTSYYIGRRDLAREALARLGVDQTTGRP